MIWIVLLASMLLHEMAHAAVAELCGDATARRAGRMSVNPLRHIDVGWTIVLPVVTYVLSHGALLFGRMRPVPVAYHALSRGQRIAVALAGPASNLMLAACLFPLSHEAAQLNLVLCLFNLIPVPPCDGWRVVEALRA